MLTENLKANQLGRVDFEYCNAFFVEDIDLVQALAQSSSLKTLMFKGTSLCEYSLSELIEAAKNPHVENLTIRNYSPSETREDFVEAIAEWVRSSPNLRQLTFDHLTLNVPLDPLLDALENCQNLECLHLWYMHIGRDEEKLLQIIDANPRLKGSGNCFDEYRRKSQQL